MSAAKAHHIVNQFDEDVSVAHLSSEESHEIARLVPRASRLVRFLSEHVSNRREFLPALPPLTKSCTSRPLYAHEFG